MVSANVVRIVEVGPRDGLQNIKQAVSTPHKVELIDRLHSVGLKCIELTSIVSPRAVPQLSDNRELLIHPTVTRLNQDQSLRTPVLVPNAKGLEIAKSLGVKEVAVFVSASEGFSRANINCSVSEGLSRAKVVAESARKSGIAVRGYVSCIFSCPFDGLTPVSSVYDCVQQLLQMGCYEVSLGDTVGTGCVVDVQRLLQHLFQAGVRPDTLAGHFHDTYGQALANVWAAYKLGIRVFDSSVAGLGGCPYAPGAKGNVATEDLVYLFHGAGVATGVDLARLADVGQWISQVLSKDNGSRAGSAIISKRRPNATSSQQKQPQLSWNEYRTLRDIKVYRSGTNLKIVLNRPRNGNALTEAMISDMTQLFETTAADPTITRIALTSKGKFFCTGMDLSRTSSPVGQGGSASDAQFERLTRLFEAIDNAPQVTIACVQGPAFGGGVGLAFVCDIRIFAQSSATMTLSEVKLGLCPATISKYIVREWGPAFAREAMLSARPVSASELARHGLVSRLVQGQDEADLSKSLEDVLTQLRSASPRGSAMTKELIKLACPVGDRSSAQGKGIRALFDEMMSTAGEGAYGLARHQAGEKTTDWDAYTLAKSKAKL